MVKRFSALILGLCMILMLSATGSSACTAVYVGKEASDDGTYLFIKSNDTQAVWGNHVELTERVENVSGRTMPVDNAGKVQAPLPDTTFRYTSTPFFDSAVAVNGQGKDATVCANEYGVAMEMSITAFSNKEALTADPLIENGLTENTAVDLVICQSRTAREAVEVLAYLIDAYGSSEVNIALIADQREAWYMEMYNGHQYAAVKLPDDQVCAFGNEFGLEYVSDYEDCFLSPGLETLAKDNGFAVYDPEKGLNLLETYSGKKMYIDYSHRRTWIGHKLLAPGSYGDYEESTSYPLCFTAEKKVSALDLMEMIRNRFEGTEYSPDETGRTDIRVIGTETALSVHLMQIDPKLPAEISCVTWECTGPAMQGVFIPVSNGALSISEPYGRNQPAEEAGHVDLNLYPYYRFKMLNTLCGQGDTRITCGIPIREYWHRAEEAMVERLKTILEKAAGMEKTEEARKLITDYCNRVQVRAFEDAGKIWNDVLLYLGDGCNSLKNGRNPETGEVLDELKAVTPVTITLDPTVYGLEGY